MGTISYSSSVKEDIRKNLLFNKFYLRKIKKSYKLYETVKRMAKEDEILFSR
jgi:hypothetical protein